MGDFDPFELFRTTLFIAVTLYTLAGVPMTVMIVRKVLRGAAMPQQMLRAYVIWLLLTVRWRPLRGELIQIALWGGVVLMLWQCHRWL